MTGALRDLLHRANREWARWMCVFGVCWIKKGVGVERFQARNETSVDVDQ